MGPRWLLALFSSIALALSFPLTYAFTGLPWLAWLSLVPLGLATLRSTPKQAFWQGWLAGTVAYLAILSWVTHTMQNYGHLPFVISLALLVMLAGYVGFYLGLLTYGWRWFATKMPRSSWLIVPLLWVTLEWMRAHLLSGFPWALLGYSQYRQLAIIQIADVTSVYGVSFLIMLVNVGFTHLLAHLIDREQSMQPSSRLAAFTPLVVATLLVTLAIGYGAWRISTVEASLTPGPRVGLIQGNIPQDLKWDPAALQATLETYERLTRQAAAQGAEVIIWPEASAPFLFENESDYQQRIRALAASTKRHLLFGSPAIARTSSTPKLFNSAYLLNPDGTTQARYDKLHLVPFGEYVPLGPLLSFVDSLVAGIGDFIPGEELVLMEAAGTSFGIAICFEIIFPELVRLSPLFGAKVIATITNDAWFGRSAAPLQHFSMAVFRAVENRTPIVRSANTGISGVIHATGAIGQTSELDVEAVLVETIALSEERTIYTRAGNIFAIGCGILVAVSIIVARRRSKLSG